eukprot:m.489560 g.489560  ORF g.489560 m.489560 type:complete len:143 (-) comp57239_c1_seq16:5-433(-)
MEALDGGAFSLEPPALHYPQQVQTQQQQALQTPQFNFSKSHKRPKSIGSPHTAPSTPHSAKNSPLTKDGEHSAGQDGDYLTRLSSPEPKKIIRSRGGVVPEGTPEGKIFQCMDCGKQYLSQPGEIRFTPALFSFSSSSLTVG